MKKIQELVTNNLRVFKRRFFPDMKEVSYAYGGMQSGYRVPSLAVFSDHYIGGNVGGNKPSTYARSIDYWNEVIKAAGIKAVFFGFDVDPKLDREGRPTKDQPNYSKFLKEVLRHPRFFVLHTTDPYKEFTYKMLKEMGKVESRIEISEDATNIGAVNPIIFGNDGKIYGENVDGYAGVKSIKRKFDLEGKKVLCIGAGSSATAITYEALRDSLGEDGELIILNRTPRRALELGNKWNELFKEKGYKRKEVITGGLDLIEKYALNSDIILSTLTAGEPISEELAEKISKDTLFVDIRYGEKAEFAKLGKKTGHKVIDGLGMVILGVELAAQIAFQRRFGITLDNKVLDILYKKLV